MNQLSIIKKRIIEIAKRSKFLSSLKRTKTYEWSNRRLRNKKDLFSIFFDSTSVQKHSLGKIEYLQHDRKRIENLQRMMKQKDLEDIKKVI